MGRLGWSRRQLKPASSAQRDAARASVPGPPPRWQRVAEIVDLRVTLARPREEVAALVTLASEGIQLEAVSVWVKNCSRAFAGRAYMELGYCVVRIGGAAHFPIREHRYPGLKTAPVYDIENWQEALVIVTAHELRHQEQYRMRVRASEIDAERWALERLEAYREARGGSGSTAALQRNL